jgi:hypothetical protein
MLIAAPPSCAATILCPQKGLARHFEHAGKPVVCSLVNNFSSSEMPLLSVLRWLWQQKLWSVSVSATLDLLDGALQLLQADKAPPSGLEHLLGVLHPLCHLFSSFPATPGLHSSDSRHAVGQQLLCAGRRCCTARGASLVFAGFHPQQIALNLAIVGVNSQNVQPYREAQARDPNGKGTQAVRPLARACLYR